MRARLGTAAHFCEEVALKLNLRAVPIGKAPRMLGETLQLRRGGNQSNVNSIAESSECEDSAVHLMGVAF